VFERRLDWGKCVLDPNAFVSDGMIGPEGQLRVEAMRDCVSMASRLSGGIPRVFLQILADAGCYAQMKRSEPWLCAEDLEDACADQVDSFRRLLMPGDVFAIRQVIGTNGCELSVDRRIRLMAHGVLLERRRNGSPVLAVHPLAQAALDEDGRVQA